MIVASPLHIPSSSSSRKTDSKRDRDRKAKKSARHDRDERRDSLIGSSWYLMCEKCRENNIKRIPAGQPPQQPQQKASAGVDQNGSPAPVRGAPVTPARASSRHLDQQQSSKLQQQLQQAEMKTRKKSLTVNIYFFIILKCC